MAKTSRTSQHPARGGLRSCCSSHRNLRVCSSSPPSALHVRTLAITVAIAPRVSVPSMIVDSSRATSAAFTRAMKAGEVAYLQKRSTVRAPWREVSALLHSNVLNSNNLLKPAFC
eukprot:CAMPEP_0185209904 /NCGR_PEP_ID=MMETSP1140-20130426/64610_1 /TAXON_ID=298111 /ORGANISM="Pavlova sp., Strain CCMP459" /LENGTH=114 /DNA_ID=CAMNT_0027777681 /DNA_START=309 /DNA_END=653 /DNA_ORIENTATION=+